MRVPKRIAQGVSATFCILMLGVSLHAFGQISPRVTPTPTPTNIYYVDTTNAAADDSNAGTNASPWKTIKGAVGKIGSTIQPGALLVIKGGDYTSEGAITISGSGASGSKITIQSSPSRQAKITGLTVSGSYLTIDGFDVANGGAGINGITVNGAYVDVINNTLHQIGRIAIQYHGSYGYVANNSLYQIAMGIEMGADYYRVENNEVNRLYYYGTLGDDDYARFFGSHGVFHGNYMHGSLPYEIGPAHVDGFQTYSSAVTDVRFECNRVFDFHEGIMAQANSTGNCNWTVINNVFDGGTAFGAGWGILLGSIVSDQGKTTNVMIANNTFVNISSYGIGVTCGSTATIKNNIFCSMSTTYMQDSASTITACNNLMFQAPDPGIGTANLLYTDPKFISLLDADYHLQAGSPAIDKGDSMAGVVTTDLENKPRPQGAGWDIGAYEYGGSGPTPTPSPVPQAKATVWPDYP